MVRGWSVDDWDGCVDEGKGPRTFSSLLDIGERVRHRGAERDLRNGEL
jgi:hypothetical protein